MEVFLWSFLGLGIICWSSGWFVALRFRQVPKAEQLFPVKVSVVIPARDEEENLARLLPSLMGQDVPPHQVIVVNDQSSDRTAEVAEKAGARVIDGKSLPESWFGKPWACHQGAEMATGDWILFLDADTVIESGGMGRIAALTADEASVHSICPYHRVKKPYEQLSAFFNVVMLLGMNAFTWRGEEAAQIGLFGQAMLVSRKQYDAVGGHELVRREVLENFHLSRHLSEAGFRCRCYLGKGTIWMRMFPSGIEDLAAGWSKGFVSGAENTPKSALAGISMLLSGLVMGMISLAFLTLAPTPVAIFYSLCVVQSWYLFRHAGNFNPLSAILFPIGLCFYQGIFFRALNRRKEGGTVEWKGRHVS